MTTLLLFLVQFASASTCLELWSQRPLQLLESTQCFLELAPSIQGEERLAALETAAAAATWIPGRTEKWMTSPSQNAEERLAFITLGEQITEKIRAEFPNSAQASYWSSVFQSQRAREDDQDAVIPTHTMKALKEIKARLRKTIEIDPSIHGYGAQRVLGIIYDALPGVVGGSKKLAEEYLSKAYAQAPRFSANALYYGKFLSIHKRQDEANKVLKDLMELEPKAFNENRIPETTLDREDAKQFYKNP